MAIMAVAAAVAVVAAVAARDVSSVARGDIAPVVTEDMQHFKGSKVGSLCRTCFCNFSDIFGLVPGVFPGGQGPV